MAGCIVEHRRRSYQQRIAKAPTCATEGCTRNVARPSFGLCEPCYYRLRRNGQIPTIARPGRAIYKVAAGYVMQAARGHPLAMGNGYTFQHRVILYDAIGPGPHPCFWCGKQLEWTGICVDHLNEIKDDNRRENLLVSCNRCNEARGSILSFIRSMRSEAFAVFVEAARGQLASEQQSGSAGAAAA